MKRYNKDQTKKLLALRIMDLFKLNLKSMIKQHGKQDFLDLYLMVNET